MPNPTHELDYYRFVAEAVRDFQRQQVEILRKANANWFITHNGLMGHVDYWEFTKDLDFLGADVYPAFGCKQPEDSVWMATYAQKCRAASGGFIVPEHVRGPGGQKGGIAPRPAPANAAVGVPVDRARRGRRAAFPLAHVPVRRRGILRAGMLTTTTSRRRRYREFAQEGVEIKRIGGKILHTVLDVQAAALIEQDQDKAPPDLPVEPALALGPGQQGVPRVLAAASPGRTGQRKDSFDGLKLLVVPSMPMMDNALAGKLARFVESGGVLVVTARTATENRDNQCIAQTPPGALSALCGAEVVEFGPVPGGQFNVDLEKTGHSTSPKRKNGKSPSLPGGPLYEILQLRGAQAVGRWTAPENSGPCSQAGEVAVSLNRVGKGVALYVGTFLTDENAGAIFDLALKHTRIAPLAQAPEAVEITRRRRDGRHSLIFALNHYPSPQTARTSGGMELISGTKCNGNLKLPPFGVAVIEVISSK